MLLYFGLYIWWYSDASYDSDAVVDNTVSNELVNMMLL